MMRLQLLNGAALVLGLGLGVGGVVARVWPAGPVVRSGGDDGPDAPSRVVDARGVEVPAADYGRIVSLHSVADHLLLSLVGPDRFVAATVYSTEQHPDSFRFRGLPSVAGTADLEAILALQPDLVVASRFTDASFLGRLAEADITVVDLGEMRGVATTLAAIDVLGRLLRQPERAERLSGELRLRLRGLEQAVDPSDRVPGLYLSVYGDSLYGGTVGTSYGDMLHYAGVHDIAADHGYVDWPAYSPEQLITLDPSLVVTQAGMAAAICGHSTLRALACCQPGGRVVEVPGRYHSDPGLGVVHAARALQARVHPGRSDLDVVTAPSVHRLGTVRLTLPETLP